MASPLLSLPLPHFTPSGACSCSVTQSCLILCDLIDYSSPGSSFPGIFQATILGRDATPFSRGSCQPRDQTHIFCISCTGRWILCTEPPGKLVPAGKTVSFSFIVLMGIYIMRKGETAVAFCFCVLLTRQDVLSLPLPMDEFGNSALLLFKSYYKKKNKKAIIRSHIPSCTSVLHVLHKLHFISFLSIS